MPKTVINILDLYLNKFLKVIFIIKESFFQINLIFSRNILEPFFGAFSLNKSAVCSLTSLILVKYTVNEIKNTDNNIVNKIILLEST